MVLSPVWPGCNAFRGYIWWRVVERGRAWLIADVTLCRARTHRVYSSSRQIRHRYARQSTHPTFKLITGLVNAQSNSWQDIHVVIDYSVSLTVAVHSDRHNACMYHRLAGPSASSTWPTSTSKFLTNIYQSDSEVGNAAFSLSRAVRAKSKINATVNPTSKECSWRICLKCRIPCPMQLVRPSHAQPCSSISRTWLVPIHHAQLDHFLRALMNRLARTISSTRC